MADAFSTLKGVAHLWHDPGDSKSRTSLCGRLCEPEQELQPTMMGDRFCKACIRIVMKQPHPKFHGQEEP